LLEQQPPPTTHLPEGGELNVEAPSRRQDWGEAPSLSALFGRSAELDLLRGWVMDDHCRLLTLVGMGGIGKSALAASLAQELAPQFEFVYWRSLALGLPPQFWLARAIGYLSENRLTPATDTPSAVEQLTRLLTERRCLLIYDNFETVLEPGERASRYREDYVNYGWILRAVGEANHRSCMIVTSREKPPEFARLEGPRSASRSLRVSGLSVEASMELLQSANLAADHSGWESLVARYGGNALALKVVAETIDELFAGDVEAFLAQTRTDTVFGDIRRLLDEHVRRLSLLELDILYWLAIEREPQSLAMLHAHELSLTSRAETLEALEALRRRSLVERGDASATFVLQPVIQEYISTCIVDSVLRELTTDQHDVIRRFPLVRGNAKDWVRRSQERFLAEAVLERMEVACGGRAAVEERLMERISASRVRPLSEQGWEPGTLVNLLRLQRGQLQSLDLSGLHLRQVYLQQIEGQDSSLAGADLVESPVTDAFNFTRSLAISPDGTYLAAGTANGEVRLWRVADRTPLLAVQAHASMVFGLAISPDGHLLASGGADGRIRVWGVGDGRDMGTLVGHAGMVYGLAFVGDGRLLLSAGLDGSVRIWDLQKGQCQRVLQSENTAAKLTVAVSEDSRVAAAGGLDGTVTLWDLVEHTRLRQFHAHAGAVRSVALGGGGALLVTAGDDAHLRVWDVQSGELLFERDPGGGGIFQVAVSRDGRTCASTASNGVVRVWETASGHCVATLSEHTNLVFSVGLTADGMMAASGGLDGTIRIWNVPGARCTATIQSHMGGVRSICLSRDTDRFVVGGVDGSVRVWSIDAGARLAVFHTYGGLMSVKLTTDAERAIVAGYGPVQVWSLSPVRNIRSVSGHVDMVYGLAVAADNSLIATGGADGTLRLCNLRGEGGDVVFAEYESSVNNVAMSGDGKMLAAVVLDEAVDLWSVARQERVARLPMGVGKSSWAIALSEDGRVLGCGGEDGVVRVWDTREQRPRLTVDAHAGGALSCALSSDGHRLATSGGDGRVRLWSVESGEALATWDEHNGAVWAVDLSRDGQWLVSGGLDGTARVWHAGRATSVHVLRPDRPYERMDITGLTGVTAAQRAALLSLGAIERQRDL
jgi:WD40 repeat protein